METNETKFRATKHVAYSATFKQTCYQCGKRSNSWWSVGGQVICDQCHDEDQWNKK